MNSEIIRFFCIQFPGEHPALCQYYPSERRNPIESRFSSQKALHQFGRCRRPYARILLGTRSIRPSACRDNTSSIVFGNKRTLVCYKYRDCTAPRQARPSAGSRERFGRTRLGEEVRSDQTQVEVSSDLSSNPLKGQVYAILYPGSGKLATPRHIAPRRAAQSQSGEYVVIIKYLIFGLDHSEESARPERRALHRAAQKQLFPLPSLPRKALLKQAERKDQVDYF